MVTNLMRVMVVGCLVLVGVEFWGRILKDEPHTPGRIAEALLLAFTAVAPALCSFCLIGILFRPDPRHTRRD